MGSAAEDLKAGDRIKLGGFTWYTVTSVDGDVVYAAEPGRTPHRFARRDVREVRR